VGLKCFLQLERLEKQKGKPSREEGVSWRTLVFCFSSLSTPPLASPIRHHPKMHLPEVALSCRVACVAPFIQNKSRFPVIYFRSLSSAKKSKKNTLRVSNPRGPDALPARLRDFIPSESRFLVVITFLNESLSRSLSRPRLAPREMERCERSHCDAATGNAWRIFQHSRHTLK